ncbi:hypothetical protein F4777DRAFT_541438 [Nemania sp. FL0916]|nr:hypothetical protein F4777DRAFT_541438 [Nemania sp. FL0916]
MGKANKALRAFIDGIPNSKLESLSTNPGKIHSDDDFRLDMQGMTSDKPPKHNLQIQINNETRISTLKKLAPKTVAGPVLVDPGKTPDPAKIKSDLKAKILI